MRILVTGASGLLGLNLALEASEEHTVFGLVNHQAVRSLPVGSHLPYSGPPPCLSLLSHQPTLHQKQKS